LYLISDCAALKLARLSVEISHYLRNSLYSFARTSDSRYSEYRNLLEMNHRKPTPLTSIQEQNETQQDDLVTKVEKKVAHALTVLWSDLPSWQQDNHYIHSGYRPETNSFSRSFSSLSYIHNETVNIYTHLSGAAASLLCSIYLHALIKPRYDRATTEDVIVFGCFFGGAIACLGMSATYHTISNHSPKVNKIGNQLDYVGIVCLIWGSFIPSIYYGFAREPGYIAVYWSMVSSVWSCVGLWLTDRHR
jgi:adiponectin receptor